MSDKYLFLLRHGKSSWDDASLDDFDRPLAPRGSKAATLMGKEIAIRGWVPQGALVSSARRTRETWALAAAQWPSPPQAVFSDAIYEAEADTILGQIRKTGDATGTLLVVGHNPGMETLARRLAGTGSDPQDLHRMHEKFPTAALARFKVRGAWRDLEDGGARLTHFIRPKEIG